MYNNIDFYVRHEGERILIARHLSRMFGRGVFQWMKPWHVIDKVRGNMEALLEQEGDFMPHYHSFADLAETMDREDKRTAETARTHMGFIRWCADKWGTFSGDAERCLRNGSDAFVLDWLRLSSYKRIAG